jgi:hypothetical protein
MITQTFFENAILATASICWKEQLSGVINCQNRERAERLHLTKRLGAGFENFLVNQKREDIVVFGSLAALVAWLFVFLPVHYQEGALGARFYWILTTPLTVAGYIFEDIVEYVLFFSGVALLFLLPYKFFPRGAVEELSVVFKLDEEKILDRFSILTIHFVKAVALASVVAVTIAYVFWFFESAAFKDASLWNAIYAFFVSSVVHSIIFWKDMDALIANSLNDPANSPFLPIINYYSKFVQLALIGTTIAVANYLFVRRSFFAIYRTSKLTVLILTGIGVVAVSVLIPSEEIAHYVQSQFRETVFVFMPVVSLLGIFLLSYCFLVLLRVVQDIFGFSREPYANLMACLTGIGAIILFWSQFGRMGQPPGGGWSLLILWFYLVLGYLPASIVWFWLAKTDYGKRIASKVIVNGISDR